MRDLLVAIIGTGACFVAVDFLVDGARSLGSRTVFNKAVLKARRFGVVGALLVAGGSYALTDYLKPTWMYAVAFTFAVIFVVIVAEWVAWHQPPD